MYPTTMLEWFHDGAWKRIGWVASTPRTAADLKEHGANLAAKGRECRLVQPSVYAGQPPEVVYVFPVGVTR